MAKALLAPLAVEAGEYRGWKTRVKDETGTVIPDLAGYGATVKFSGPAKRGVLPLALIELSTDAGTIQRDGGLFRWALTPESSRLLPPVGWWQMYVWGFGGRPTRIYEGPVTTSPDIRSADAS